MLRALAGSFAVGAVALLSGGADASLIAHYNLDETSGTTAVDSVAGNNGTITGGPNLNVPGILNTGIEFTGDSTFVQVASAAQAHGLVSGNAARSVSLWFADDTAATGTGTDLARLIGWGVFVSGQQTVFDITLEASGVGLRYGNGNMFWNGGSSIDLFDGELHHVVMTYDGTVLAGDGSSLKVYIDGVLQSRTGGNANNTGNAIVTGANGLWIGRDDGGNNGITALIDEVRIYDHVLTQQEVTTLANVPEPGSLALLGLGALAMVRRRRA